VLSYSSVLSVCSHTHTHSYNNITHNYFNNNYQVDTARLLTAKDIRCRAWQGQNTQPQLLTWNLLGMMNNCHFRVLIHPFRTESGELALRFEHPTLAGPQPGGWMVKSQEPVVEVKKTGTTVAAAAVAPPASAKLVKGPISKGELAKHCKESDCWIAVEGKVYDVTAFLDDHPGTTLLLVCQLTTYEDAPAFCLLLVVCV
jgi:nitrate reductase (NAD(P)H)